MTAVMPYDVVPIGQHCLLDLIDVDAALACDANRIEIILRRAAELAGATPIHSHFHHFGEGQGVTGVLLLRESHISIHTWPEHGFVAVDVFMCGNARPQLAIQYMQEAFSSVHSDVRNVSRGCQR